MKIKLCWEASMCKCYPILTGGKYLIVVMLSKIYAI